MRGAVVLLSCQGYHASGTVLKLLSCDSPHIYPRKNSSFDNLKWAQDIAGIVADISGDNFTIWYYFWGLHDDVDSYHTILGH
jgi:hypothetical protein